jgi:hypothetical protein
MDVMATKSGLLEGIFLGPVAAVLRSDENVIDVSINSVALSEIPTADELSFHRRFLSKPLTSPLHARTARMQIRKRLMRRWERLSVLTLQEVVWVWICSVNLSSFEDIFRTGFIV